MAHISQLTDARSSRVPATQDDGSEVSFEPFSFSPSTTLDIVELKKRSINDYSAIPR